MNRILLCCILSLLLLGACQSSQDLLIGKWQVAVIERDGQVIGGPAFNGTVFDFRADGSVQTLGVDTSIVQYERKDMQLVYIQGELREEYRIDSLTEEVLVIFSDADGVPTQTTMVRLEE